MKKAAKPAENSGGTVKKRGRIENLRPWKPGQSGNPGGRPKKTRLSDAYRAILAQQCAGDYTVAEEIARVVKGQALRGKQWAIQELREASEGKSPQAVKLTGPNGGPVEITEVSAEENDRRIRELASQLGYTGAQGGTAGEAETPAKAEARSEPA